MNIKTCLLLIPILATSFFLKASKYPLPAKGATYGYIERGDYGKVSAYLRHYTFIKDVEINGKTYQAWSNSTLIRNESNKVYIFETYKNEEKLLYDFSLKTNDSIIIEGITFKVTSVDTLSIDNQKRKALKLKHFGVHQWEYTWIEGIGDLKDGFLYSYPFEMADEYDKNLACYCDSSGFMYKGGDFLSEVGSNVSCDYILELNKVNADEIESEPVYAYLDATQMLHIVTELELRYVSLNDASGRRVMYSESKNVSLSGIAAGMYAISATFEDGSVYSGMIAIP
jgi:hypothetical protein